MKWYIDKIHEYINKLEYENEEKSSKELLLENAVKYIEDVVDTTELILTSYDNDFLDIRVDGCDLLNNNEIALYVSDYSDNDYDLSQKEVEVYLKKICNYVNKSVKGFSKDLNDSDPIKIVSDYIFEKQNEINKIHLFVVSSKKYEGKVIDNIRLGNIVIDTFVFDASFLKEHGFLQDSIENEILIDLKKPVEYIKCADNSDKMDVYLLFLKGEDIAAVYEKYGYLMLEGNVRAYLKKTNKQNQGILETIGREPDYFVAYNNGLSTVADAIETVGGKISKIIGWRIVNGGQTTASIYEAYKENGGKLNRDIFVPVKLTILKSVTNPEELVSRIAEYANTQSKVSQSDLNSNEAYHVELEKISKSCCVPSKVKGKELKKWYYERLRGQYNLSRDRAKNIDAFDAEYPAANVFDKLDLSKAVMVWEQEPYTTAMGKEKCFNTFDLRIKGNLGQYVIDEKYYKKIVALIILYRSISKVVKEMRYGGFGSNIVEYTGSVLSLITDRKLNLDLIWNDQKIDDDLESIIKSIAYDVTEIITDVPKDQKNVQMYCRQTRCWDEVKKYDFEIEVPNHILSEVSTTILENNSTTVVNGVEKDINDLDPSFWGEMSKWGKDTELLSPQERKMAFTACRIARSGYQWKSDKQRDFAKAVYIKAINAGFKGGDE